jgi:hypothetical protein
MRGSLAVWCTSDNVEVSGHAPLVELHFNIWCGLPGNTPDVLDIGILFKEPRPISELFLYIPRKVKRDQLKDLSQLLKEPTTLSAVFNDTLDVGSERIGSFEVLKSNAVSFRIVSVDLDNPAQATIEVFSEEDGEHGTIIRFGSEVISQMLGVGDHYIRLRLALSGALSDMLVSRIEPSDRLFLSSFYRTQMIEFRLNEKRNFSRELRERQKKGRPPSISAVHYFLVRDLSVEMVQSHATFRKMRRLEPRLWDNYLSGLGSPKPEDMIIYHWREIAEPGATVEDFIALTSFRQAGNNLWLYIAAIIFLGAIGSSTQSLLTSVLSGITNWLGYPLKHNSAVQFVIVALLAGSLLLLYWRVRPQNTPRQRGSKVNNSKTHIGDSSIL